MKVVLDSNILIADYNLKKPAALILLEQSKSGMLDVYIPELVIDEVINKFRQRVESATGKILSELEIMTDLTTEEIMSPIANDYVDDSTRKYKKRLLKLLMDNKVNIMAYPKTKHKFLAKKAMAKKKPFNANEKGYRDCLIWENVKSLISVWDKDIASCPELIFITNNHTDFMSGDGLHEDLLSELDDDGLRTDSVAVYKSLHEFSDKVMKLYLVQAKTFKKRLINNDFDDFELKQFLIDFLYKDYVGHSLGDFEFVAPGDFPNDEREVASFNEDFEIQNLTVRKLSADQYVIDLSVDLETELEFYIDKYEYPWGDETSICIIDANWNDYVMLVGKTESLSFTFTIILDSTLDCQSIEMNKVE